MGSRERPWWEDHSTRQPSNSPDAQHRSPAAGEGHDHPEGAHICLPVFSLANPMTIMAIALRLAQHLEARRGGRFI
jgi:hypothetical protein